MDRPVKTGFLCNVGSRSIECAGGTAGHILDLEVFNNDSALITRQRCTLLVKISRSAVCFILTQSKAFLLQPQSPFGALLRTSESLCRRHLWRQTAVAPKVIQADTVAKGSEAGSANVTANGKARGVDHRILGAHQWPTEQVHRQPFNQRVRPQGRNRLELVILADPQP